MTDKPTPTDAELKAMWQLHAADIGGIFHYARAVLAKWGQPTPPSDSLTDLLKEARKIIRASSSRNLTKDWDARATRAIATHHGETK